MPRTIQSRRPLRRCGKLDGGVGGTDGNAEFPGQGQQIIHIWGGQVRFPFADGLTADPQPGPQFLLRDVQFFSVAANALAQSHGGVLLLTGEILGSAYHKVQALATTRLSTIGCGLKKDGISRKNACGIFL